MQSKQVKVLSSPQLAKKGVSIAVFSKTFKNYVATRLEAEKEKIVDKMIEEILDGNIEAFKALFDRVMGKPAQSVDLGTQNGTPIVFMPMELIDKRALHVESSVIEGQQPNEDVKQDQ